MAVYSYTEPTIETILDQNKRFRLRFCLIAVPVLIATWLLRIFNSALLSPSGWTWMLAVVNGVFGVGLFNNLRGWKSLTQKRAVWLRQVRIEVSPAGLTFGIAPTVRQIARSEIDRVEDPSWGVGLRLRTRNRYRWFVVPRTIDGFDRLKHELQNMGIPVVSTSSLPNWEEFVGVFLFMSTILLPFYLHTLRAATAVFLVALLSSLFMLFFISANPDNLPRMKWTRLVVFLPAVIAGYRLWLLT